MNPTLLADPAAAPESEQSPDVSPEPAANGTAPGAPPVSAGACPTCSGTLDTGQDWCLQCGAGAPGSLGADGPSWRSAATILAATAVLVLGAGAAAYAALSKSAPRKIAPRVVTVTQVPPATTGLGTTSTQATTTPGALGTPTTIKPLPSATKPPKIPLTAATPTSSGTTTPTTGLNKSSTSGTTKTQTKSSVGTNPGERPSPTPILLDTDAASTYNPYGYPASDFGDPRLAIDGETATAWTAQVEPSVAPKMAEGLVIDLKTAQKVSSVTLNTSTPGMTVQMYGANGHTLPSSITDHAWVPLSSAKDAKKSTTKIKLRDSSKAFRFVALWISKAPEASIGTPQVPGHVAVNELELFPTT